MSRVPPRLCSILKAMSFLSEPQYDLKTVQSMRKSFKSSLADFATSGSAFRILYSVPGHDNAKLSVKTLYVLDSSFNPPTKAHMHLARSTLQSDQGRQRKPLRLLLLLAIKNADKAPKPAEFEDRLVMMTLMAEDLAKESQVAIDVGITSEPFYYKKAEVVKESRTYEGLESGEQVHITGFDTIIRIFDKKYYPNGMSVLESMFNEGRLRVYLRDDDKQEQRGYLEKIRNGMREEDGVKASWAEKIKMVDPMPDTVSSTEARECVVEKKGDGLERYVGESVKWYILHTNLYDENSVKKGAQWD